MQRNSLEIAAAQFINKCDYLRRININKLTYFIYLMQPFNSMFNRIHCYALSANKIEYLQSTLKSGSHRYATWKKATK